MRALQVGAALLFVTLWCGAVPGGAFTVGIEMPAQVPVTPAVEAALRGIGVGYINYFVKPWASTSDETALEVNAAMLEFAERMGVDFSLSCFVVDPPDRAVADAQALGERFRGIVFDEIAHARLLNPHEYAADLADRASFTSLADAYEKTLAGYRALHDRYAAQDVPVVATHVFPVLHHVAARAGFIPCPKIQKEFYSSVSLAIGLGAALQYDRDLWVDCDLWYYDLVPGHPPEEFFSNLQLAYWLGADLVYVEGAGHNLTPVGSQGIPFSLMTQVTPDLFQLTAHGEALRRFIREYVPAHPRPWTFRDIQPTIAIVRFPDSDYGQRFQYAPPADPDAPMADWHAGLYGTANLPGSPDTEAWFDLWNLLTHGATGADGLSHFKSYIAAGGYERPVRPEQVQSLYSRPVQAAGHRFFVPLNNVVVFDHLVDYERLRDIPLIFVVGVEVSDATLAALMRRAEEGATVVFWGSLARKKGVAEFEGGFDVHARGDGQLVLTDSFSTNRMFQQVWPYMGRPDEIRYTFGEHSVTLKRVTDNEVAVRVSQR